MLPLSRLFASAAAAFVFATPLLGQVCATCHSEIARTYARTGMGRSFYRPSTQAMVEDFTRGNPFFHQSSGTWYAMVQRDGQYFQRQWRVSPAGQEIHVQESRIDYVMGSGNHVRSYLHRTARGALTELPLAWYAEKGGMWAMGPGHDRDYMLPPRAIAYECMFCHNAYPRIPEGHNEAGSEPLYAGDLPEGIDCQRCHGSGANHVRIAQTAGSSVEAIRKAIVNPARLSSERQMEVCMQCHLETTSLPLPHSVVRYDRAPFSYRPGEPLGNFMIFFDHATGSKYQDDFEIAHSAYRLRKSQCFLRSNRQVDLHYLSQSARRPAWRGGGSALQCSLRHLPYGEAHRVARLRRLPHAEAPDPGRDTRRDDGSLDPTPAACRRRPRPDRRTAGVRRAAVFGRSGSLLPVAFAAHRGERALSCSGAGRTEKQFGEGIAAPERGGGETDAGARRILRGARPGVACASGSL